jgi:hypothetical protein
MGNKDTVYLADEEDSKKVIGDAILNCKAAEVLAEVDSGTVQILTPAGLEVKKMMEDLVSKQQSAPVDALPIDKF